MNRVLLEELLWKIERLIDFHHEDEYRDNFPRLRSALARVRQLVQALGPPVVLYEPYGNMPIPASEPCVVSTVPDESPDEFPIEPLIIRIQPGTGKRTVKSDYVPQQ